MPVLSEQITVTLPRVSTLGSRRTNAFLATIRCRPIAKTTVTTAGSPSGTAATARLTARRSTSVNVPSAHIAPSPRCRQTSSPKITATTARETTIRIRPSSVSRRCSGVVSGGAASSRLAIRPSSLSIPVATTTAAAWPAATTVPAWTIVARSPRGASAATVAAAAFSTDMLSPVSEASWSRSENDSTSRASAGTASPASSSIRSPGTISRAGIERAWPSRITFASGAASRWSAASAAWARSS